jgi:hypothetical protein
MTKLPYDRLAAFSLGVMTTVLLLAPAGKAQVGGWQYDQQRQIDQLRREQQHRESQQQQHDDCMRRTNNTWRYCEAYR